MQFKTADLRHRRQSFDAINLQIGFAIAGDLDQFQQVRGAAHRMALKEGLPTDAVGRTHH